MPMIDGKKNMGIIIDSGTVAPIRKSGQPYTGITDQMIPRRQRAARNHFVEVMWYEQ